MKKIQNKKQHVSDRPFFKKSLLWLSFFSLLFIFDFGCKKLVEIPPPTGSITTTEVFADSANATGAIEGIYTNMIYAGNGSVNFGSGDFTLYCGESADELYPFSDIRYDHQIVTNTVTNNNTVTNIIWDPGYFILYQANAAIEGLTSSKTIAINTKNELIGEAEWFRAFVNFYLVNCYGDIPLVTSTDFKSNSIAKRTPVAQVYQQIIADLKDAQRLLPADYSAGGGQRVRVNKWAATALLARAYLFEPTPDYIDAAKQSDAVIKNTGLFSLVADPNNIFTINNSEAILQWLNNPALNGIDNLTPEGFLFISYNPGNAPTYYLTTQLLNAFEPGDARYAAWIRSFVYTGDGKTYFYPYKYKTGVLQASTGAGSATEYYTVLRLGEQYLIRSESEAHTGDLQDAVKDLNVIRERAKLPDLSLSLTQTQVYTAVAQERRIELFCEWGHRWLDLKRTNQVGTDFSTIPYKSAYKPYQQLYPIDLDELKNDPNLVQNPGY